MPVSFNMVMVEVVVMTMAMMMVMVKIEEDFSSLYILKPFPTSEGEFTCLDGQCINIEQRCDQTPNCRHQIHQQK